MDSFSDMSVEESNSKDGKYGDVFDKFSTKIKPERADEFRNKLSIAYKHKQEYKQSYEELCRLTKSMPNDLSANDPNSSLIYNCPYLYNIPYMEQQFMNKTLLVNTRLSSVYIATHLHDKQRYAVKQSLPSMKEYKVSDCLCSNSLELWNEIKILSKINHPNIIQYYYSWMQQNQFFMQIEYLQCGSLYDYLYRCSDPGLDFQLTNTKIRPLHENYIDMMIAHIGSALCLLEENYQIFHNDVKPSNMLIGLLGPRYKQKAMTRGVCHKSLENGSLDHYFVFKLADFGRSGKYSDDIDLEDLSDGDGRYLANFPKPDSDIKCYLMRRDVFALGVTAFECFGNPVREETGSDMRESKSMLMSSTLLNEEWKNLIMKMIHPDCNLRISARQILSLERFSKHILPEATRLM